MAAAKRQCKYGRTKAGKCKKPPRRRRQCCPVSECEKLLRSVARGAPPPAPPPPAGYSPARKRSWLARILRRA